MKWSFVSASAAAFGPIGVITPAFLSTCRILFEEIHFIVFFINTCSQTMWLILYSLCLRDLNRSPKAINKRPLGTLLQCFTLQYSKSHAMFVRLTELPRGRLGSDWGWPHQLVTSYHTTGDVIGFRTHYHSGSLLRIMMGTDYFFIVPLSGISAFRLRVEPIKLDANSPSAWSKAAW